MKGCRLRVSGSVVIVGLAASFLFPSECFPQAWLPTKGEGTVSTTFQRVNAGGHFLDDGSRLPGYRTRATNLPIDVTYGITDRVAVSLTVPFVNVKYVGPEEPFNLPENVLDDGTYHGTVPDLRFEVRYNALQQPFVATPFFAASIPSHDYKTIGEAAAGRNFQEYLVGSYAGRLLDPFLPRAFVHAAYTYAFVRQDLKIPLNRSNFELETGYFVLPSVPISFLWRRQWTHGGLSFDELFAAPPDIFRNLDRVVHVNFQHVGVAIAFPLGESVSVHANFVKFIGGVNAHYGSSFAAGLSWSFQTRRMALLPINP